MPSVFNTKEGSGVDLLLNVANQIHQQRTQNRAFELEKNVTEARLAQATEDNKIASVNARANLLNALSASGYISKVQQEELSKDLPFVQEFTPQAKEFRKAQGQIAVEQEKVQGRLNVNKEKSVLKKGEIETSKQAKLETIGAKGKLDLDKEKFKQGALDVRQERGQAIEVAKFGLTPSEIAKGTEAVSESNPLKADRLRTGRDAIVIPGFKIAVGDLSIGEVGKKTITTDDIIETIGSENISPGMQDGFKLLNEMLGKAKTGEEKTQIINYFIQEFPELAPLFE